MQKNANPKSNHGKGKPAPSGAFTHRIREDGEIFSGEEGRETSSDTTPLASVAGSVRMRSTDSDRSVRATPKKARDASPPPQDDLLEVKPVVPKVVVPRYKDYPPLPPTGATSKRKTVATKPNPTTTTATTTTTTTLASPLRTLDLLMLSKGGPPTNSWLNASLNFPGDLRKAMQGARIRTSAVRDIRWISRQVVQLLVDADYVSAFTRIITSLDATIVKSFKAWIPRLRSSRQGQARCYFVFCCKDCHDHPTQS
ncbi:hypothetical protein BASA62_008964 [Batrachochytrium salamandrivorans]|nr:hypothetical protein BASA62_008964 [Batrachochytrium salamandrivorans]